ncbi:rhodanese-like domain-containing protein [Salinicola avicenniae]|uniref:rhodanese-like domain-containing protein n=1 Tax=Salinicola avicenniae TaxID=2916836 RepID=UPI002072B0CC|nr:MULTISPECIES: rhodanese-like domain-containing protein [unclassified Salinicola]
MTAPSLVLDTPPVAPDLMAVAMAEKLARYSDAWDLAVDLASGVEALVVIDTRAPERYAAGHIPGALSLPHVEMTPARLTALSKDRVYVCYCDGIGCNGSTRGAFKLASAGLRVKELLGGLDFWKRDGHPVATGAAPGALRAEELADCGCGETS